jgi:hypothetical protein
MQRAAGLAPPDRILAAGRELLASVQDDITAGEQGHDDQAQLERLISLTLEVIRRGRGEEIARAISDLARDPATMQALRLIAESEAGSHLTDQIPKAETTSRSLGILFLAGALLLAAGVAVPILAAGVVAETILANEIAVAALIVAVAALRK